MCGFRFCCFCLCWCQPAERGDWQPWLEADSLSLFLCEDIVSCLLWQQGQIIGVLFAIAMMLACTHPNTSPAISSNGFPQIFCPTKTVAPIQTQACAYYQMPRISALDLLNRLLLDHWVTSESITPALSEKQLRKMD